VLRKTFGPKRDEVTVEWRRLHNEEHYAVCSSLHIIREIKSREKRWAGNIARMGRGEAHTGLRWEDVKEDQIKKNEMGGECNTYVERRGSYRASVGRAEGRRPLRRPGRRWEINIKMNLQEVGWGGMEWIGLVQDRERWRALVNSVMKFGLRPAGNFVTS
jgi:hypothetical protein